MKLKNYKRRNKQSTMNSTILELLQSRNRRIEWSVRELSKGLNISLDMSRNLTCRILEQVGSLIQLEIAVEQLIEKHHNIPPHGARAKASSF